MDNVKTSWWQAHRPTTRRLVQLYSALLHNAHVRGFIDGQIYQGKAKYACAPGFNCYSCPGAVGACPLGSIQNALGSAGHRAGWYVLGIILLYGVILGRTVCGWLCPLGLIQELLHKIPTPKIRKNPVTRALCWLKYVLLAVFVIAIPLTYGLRYDLPLPAFCKYICPAGTSEGAMGLLSNPANAGMFSMLGVLFTRKFVIMLAIGLACVFCFRAFCRFVCPLGAVYGLFNRFNVIGVRVDAARCNGCGACVRGCKMDVRRVGDHECIQCGKCVDTCNQGAIAMKAGGRALRGPDGRGGPGRVIWAAALMVLCLALLWFNVLDPSLKKAEKPVATEAPAVTEAPAATEEPIETEEPATTEAPAATEAPTVSWDSDAPIGHEVGQQLEDFTLTCYDGTDFHLAKQRGKVTFINFWATSCTPCKQELPYFNELYQEKGDDIAMLIVHPSLVIDDPEEYLSDKGYVMPCATDTDDDTLMEIVGGTGTFPQTVVLNRRGEVVYNKIGSVTPEMLSALFDEADRQQ